MRNNRGFTLVEALASLAFAGIVVPVLVKALLIANTSGVLAERQREAAMLASQKMNETVLLTDWRNGLGQGQYQERPGWRWEVDSKTWEEDSLQVLTVTVYFSVQNHEQHVTLSTLVEETTE